MPRYEYQCDNCGEVVERQRSIAERHDTELHFEDNCGGLFRLVPSLTSFTLVGGGWTPKGDTPAPPRKPRRRGGYDMTGDRDLG